MLISRLLVVNRFSLVLKAMFTVVLFRWILLLLSGVIASSSSSSGSSESNASFFTWMTPYDTSKPTDWDTVLSQIPETCSLNRVNVVARHGTRTPSVNEVKNAQQVVAKLKAYADKNSPSSASQSELLATTASWSSQLQGGQDLHPVGAKEHHFLAQDYYNLLKKYKIDSGRVTFSSTNTSRTIDSSSAFRSKWLATMTASDNFSVAENLIDVKHLYFFENCERYVKEIRVNRTSRPEFVLFDQSLNAKAVVKAVNERLFQNQVTSDDLLSWENITALYYMAGYETAIFGSSVLTKLFSMDDLAVLDYSDDVETYWKSSSGYPINYKIGCVLANKIFGSGDGTTENCNNTTGVFQFTHSEAIVPLLNMFNLFNDSIPLTANASSLQISTRKFKASIATPFAANMAFLFFDCKGKDDDKANAKWVAIVVNGKLQTWTSVDDLSRRHPLAFKCNYAAMCDINCSYRFDDNIIRETMADNEAVACGGRCLTKNLQLWNNFILLLAIACTSIRSFL